MKKLIALSLLIGSSAIYAQAPSKDEQSCIALQPIVLNTLNKLATTELSKVNGAFVQFGPARYHENGSRGICQLNIGVVAQK